ncbi:LacI family DNA-binding transcriptional regulator [Microbacteriaceae bacterium VKM Ac-2854]|nr:LacI family DNA-binding transcriptional regulator [Microbacteriaceae bacterium VKM Ac-2854]
MRPSATKPATIYDVARVAGVSHQSVSRYLRGVEGLRESTRTQIEAALAQVDYRANVTARNLRRGRTGMIALSIPSLEQPYFAELAQAVIHAGRAEGLTVFVETTDLDRDRELAVLQHFGGDVVDGVLFAPSVIGREDLDAARSTVPLVLLGDRISDSGIDHVTISNRAAAECAVTHLLMSGRRRIVALGVQPEAEFGAAPLRLAGYLDAHRAAGVDVPADLAAGADSWVRAEGAAAIARLIEAGTRFDAVFGFNDALALGALRALQSAGLRVPDDVAVVGIDDIQDAIYSTPSLTSVAPGLDEIAREGVRMLVERIEGSTADARELLVGFHLEQRESSAPLEVDSD